ncbi:MAG: hypothetical protein GY861_08200 [bacterium]|nr:hypothetical protein [bacterium]
MSSVSVRYFFVSDNNEIFRVPTTKYKRLLKGSIEKKAKRFAGKRVRAAEIVVEIENRKPILVLHTTYFYLHFTEKGILDYDSYWKNGGALFEAKFSDLSAKNSQSNVINARYPFTKKQLRWEPGMQLERNILDASIDEFKCERM